MHRIAPEAAATAKDPGSGRETPRGRSAASSTSTGDQNTAHRSRERQAEMQALPPSVTRMRSSFLPGVCPPHHTLSPGPK
jgi:hypothetical protein